MKEFRSYGNENYQDTVTKAIPGYERLNLRPTELPLNMRSIRITADAWLAGETDDTASLTNVKG